MFDNLKRFFNKNAAEGSEKNAGRSEHDIRVATCALFVEMARIDNQFTRDEVNTIISILKDRYGVAQEDADALLLEADQELEKASTYGSLRG